MNVSKLTILNVLKPLCIAAAIFAAGLNVALAKAQNLPRKNFREFSTYSGNFMAANSALHARDYESAADFLMALYAEDSKDTTVVESLFLVNFITGDFNEARLFAQKYHRDILDKDEAQSSHHYLSKLFLTASQVKRGDFRKALGQLQKGDDFMISEMSFHLLSTWINFANGRPLNAVDSLNQLKENSFHRIYYLINSAVLAEMQDRQQDADGFYNDALLLGGSKLDLIEAYGRFLERTGREKQAFALYDDFENRGGDHPVISAARERLISGVKPEPFIANPTEAIAYSFYHISNIYYGAGNFDEALNYARLAQYLSPSNKYILDILSLNYQGVGKYIEANKILQQIDPDSPFFVKAQIRMAANFEINGENGRALAKLAALLDEEKIDEDIHIAYANMLKRNEKYSEAIEYYSDLIDKRILLTINDAGLFYNRAVSLERLKKWQQAEVDFVKAIELDPNHINALNYLGYTWVDQGVHLDKALEMINNALLLNPQNAFIIDSLGWAYFKLGKYEEARIELERAQLVSPSNADIADHLGDVYWKLGRELEAGFKWQSATIFKSDEINYDDLEYKREHGLDALDARKAAKASSEAANETTNEATSENNAQTVSG